MRKHLSLIVALGLLASAILGLRLAAWMWRIEPRASVMIVSHVPISSPMLRINGRAFPYRASSLGPWEAVAWADLLMPERDVELALSWIGADGRQRSLQVTVFQASDSVSVHCAYLLNLDAQGEPIAPAGRSLSGPLMSACHH